MIPPPPPVETAPSGDDGARVLPLEFRSAYGAPPPRRIRLQIPGWSGDDVPPRDGSAAMPWHCRPFVDGATYGLELVYPYRGECRVHNDGGRVRFSGPVEDEVREGGIPHPFGTFAAGHYGMATAMDLLPPPGYALRLGPHPRYFTDGAVDVPLAVPGHLQRFWPVQFFAVFRVPPAGAVHVFRPGEPYAQLLVVPAAQTLDVRPMEPARAGERARQDRLVTLLTYFLSKRLWRSDTGYWFNDKYKQLLRIFRRGGEDAVRRHLQGVEDRMTTFREKE